MTALAPLPVALGAAGAGAAAAADYVTVPAGKLTSVLSGGSAADVALPVDAFALRTTPVTDREFSAFTAAHPEWRRGQAPAVFADASYLHQHRTADDRCCPTRPVTSVSWFAAQAFCDRRRSAACPPGTNGNTSPRPTPRAPMRAATRPGAPASWPGTASPRAMRRPRSAAPANLYGVRDMHGLVWEWVDDFNALLVSADSRSQGDPDQLQFCGAGAISLQDRENYAILMRVALLSSLRGADTTDNLGFRCARPLPKEQK